jgi:hypothetical protein
MPQQKVQGRLHYRDDQIQLRARVLAAMEVGQQRIVAVPLEPGEVVFPSADLKDSRRLRSVVASPGKASLSS